MKSHLFKLSLFSTFLIASVFTSGCSTAKVRVMPGEEGVNRVIADDIEKDGAEKASVDAAEDFCKERHKHAVFFKNETKYTGSMNEDTRNTIRSASRAASIVGFQTRTASAGTGMSSPGLLENAGTAGSSMTNNRDYKSEMTFKCQ